MRRVAKPAKAEPGGAPATVGIDPPARDADAATAVRELAQAREQLDATSEILRVISRSRTETQPVLDAIADAALRLCRASSAAVFTFDGELIHVSALASINPQGAEALRRAFPRPPSRDTAAARAILARKLAAIPDILVDAEYAITDPALASGFRSTVSVPLLHDGQPIGAIGVGRPERGPFSDEHIAMLETFAAQAVIAIENVRLFNELTARNSDVVDALAQQTAASDILRVISRSPTDAQPVFAIIAERAVALCGAEISIVSRVDGDLIRLAALHGVVAGGVAAIEHAYPLTRSSEAIAARAIRARDVVHVFDVLADPRYDHKEAALAGRWRGSLAVPMMSEGSVVGAIFVARAEPGYFSDRQVELLKVFADQAVIAIQNVRLFAELDARTQQLTRSVAELKALGEVGRAVSSTIDLETVLGTIVTRATELTAMDGGAVYEYDESRQAFHLQTSHKLPDEIVAMLRAEPIRAGEGALGRLAVTPEPVQIADIADEATYQSRIRNMLIGRGYRSLLAVPLLREDRLLGGLVVNRSRSGGFAPEVIDLLQTFATQSALAIHNARLFREIEDKGRELELASRHKSEFLANMSHELRTPLNAIIGFSEVLSEQLFGDVNDKQMEYLRDILESGRHLLSLINDILDLAKIEAGRLELEPSDFDLGNAIDNTLVLMRERAQRRSIALRRVVHDPLGTICADERKVKQVLLNLLSNAIKFTPEGGRIDVIATVDASNATVAVTDTGVGISAEDQAVVFEEFRQVGAATKRTEGTGLGLAISRKFIELHGGRMWVDSAIGQGSTFGFSVPRR